MFALGVEGFPWIALLGSLMLYFTFGFVLFFLELCKLSEELGAHLSSLVWPWSFVFSHMTLSC